MKLCGIMEKDIIELTTNNFERKISLQSNFQERDNLLLNWILSSILDLVLYL